MTIRELVTELTKLPLDLRVGVMVTSDPDLNDFISDITQVVVKDNWVLIVGEP